MPGKVLSPNRQAQVADMLLDRFFENFAAICSKTVVEHNNVDEIYEIAIGNVEAEIPKQRKEMLVFRAAYILEKIFFNHRHHFEPYKERFFDNFTATTSESAKRHFAKMMAHHLRTTEPTFEQSEAIAETCIHWVTEQRTKVAVKIWAIEILLILSNRIEWLRDVVPEILAHITYDTSPAMIARMKRWKQRVNVDCI